MGRRREVAPVDRQRAVGSRQQKIIKIIVRADDDWVAAQMR